MVSRIQCFAITGGIACGKSTVAAWLPRWGGCVLDTDDVVHELEGSGGEAVPLIRASFGAGVIGPDGGIDRKQLGQRVFRHPDALGRLNALIHPLVKRRVERWLESPVPDGIRFRAVLVPLLFEAGWAGKPWDAVIAVVCDEREQIRRLIRRGLDETGARDRIAAQMSCAEKARLADYAIWNTGSRRALRETAERLFKKLLETQL